MVDSYYYILTIILLLHKWVTGLGACFKNLCVFRLNGLKERYPVPAASRKRVLVWQMFMHKTVILYGKCPSNAEPRKTRYDMKKEKQKTGYRWILALWALVLALVSILCVLMYRNIMGYTTTVVSELMKDSANQMERHTYQKLEVLESIAQKLPLDVVENPSESVAYLADYRDANGFLHMSVASALGISYRWDGTQITVSGADYFQRAMEGEKVLSDMIVSPTQGTSVNVYAVPIVRNDAVVGVLWAAVHTEDLYQRLGLEQLERYGEVFIVDSNTQLVVEKKVDTSSTNFFAFVEQQPENNIQSLRRMRADIEAGRDGYRYFHYRNEQVNMYYFRMEISDWWILVEVHKSILDNFSAKQIGTVWVATICVMIVVSIGFYRMLERSRLMQQKMDEQMMVDAITGGKNDIYLRRHMPQLVKQPGEHVFLGLKVTNVDNLVKVLGMEQVSFALRELYWRISDRLKEGEVVVHHSFGKFEILCRDLSSAKLANTIQSISVLSPEFRMAVGVYPVEPGVEDYDQMCRLATVARSNPKEGNIYGIYSQQMHDKDMERSILEKEIHQGVEEQSFKAWFQPKYSADGKTLAGAEALVRWYRDGKIMAPYLFVPLAELTGQIKEIDMCVLEDVCRQLRAWQAQGLPLVPISVNLSRNYFANTDFIGQILVTLEFYGVEPQWIEFEVTETCMENNEEDLRRVLQLLHKHGFKTALDDFGVGTSSLKALVDMEFDTIKIDKVFVDGIGQEKWENALRYSIGLSKQMNIKVVAEGVETKEQFDYLVAQGCDMIQGYYFSKPLSRDQFEELLQEKKAEAE